MNRMLAIHIDATTRSAGPARRRTRGNGLAGAIAALLCAITLVAFL